MEREKELCRLAEEMRVAQLLAEAKLREDLVLLKSKRKKEEKEFGDAIEALRTKDTLAAALGVSKVKKKRRSFSEKERYAFVEAVMAYQTMRSAETLTECCQKQALDATCKSFKGNYEG